jgi:hypothetical protein
MTLIFLVGVVLGAGGAVLVVVPSSRATIQPVDVDAFRSLMDRADEMFLRKNTSLAAFCHIKRQRIRVRGRYIRRIADHAAAFMRLSASARMIPDSEIGELVSQIVGSAARLRFQCLAASIKLAVEFAFPLLQITPTGLAQKYQTLRENVLRFNALRSQKASALLTMVSSHSTDIPRRKPAGSKRQKNGRETVDLEEEQRTELWGQEIERAASRFWYLASILTLPE